MTNKKIAAGGGKGSKEAYEAPNTLLTSVVGRGIWLFSEGPVEGLATGDGKSIYLNDVPLLDSTGAVNFKGVAWTFRNGLPDQDHISGFTSIGTPVNVATQVTFATPVTVAIPDQYDAVKVQISIPVLSQAKGSDLIGTDLSYAIDVQVNGGSWVTAVTENLVKQKCVSEWRKSYRIDLPPGGAPYNIRLRRLTPDSATVSIQNDLYFFNYTKIVDGKFNFRNSCVMGMQFEAKQFGSSIPSIKALLKGIKVWVPKNYDPVTRTYATTGVGTSGGIWDGTFKLAWTNNPVWIYNDLIVNNRYGLGQDMNPYDDVESAFVDKSSLYVLGQYCDEMVSDGTSAGVEPRYTCNIQITSKQEAYELLQSLVSLFNGMMFFSSEKLYLVADVPDEVDDIFTQADVVDGIFEYSGSSLKSRHSVAMIYYNNPNNLYKRDAVVWEDLDLIDELGYRNVEVQAFGCTSRAQAIRTAKWLIRTEGNQTQIVGFKTGNKGGLLTPGKLIKIFDEHKAGRRSGGRIMSMSQTTNTTFTLDQNVTVTTGDKFCYVDSLGEYHETYFSTGTVNGPTVTVAGVVPLPVESGVYGIVYADLEGVIYKILNVKEDEETGIYQVSALEHDANKFAYIDEDILLDDLPTSVIPTGQISPPTNVNVETFYQTINGSEGQPKFTVSWSQPDDFRAEFYELQVRGPLEDYKTVYQGSYTTWDSPLMQVDDEDSYKIRVRAGGNLNAYSTWVYSTAFSLLGNEQAPDPPTNVAATAAINSIIVTWDNPTNPDFKHVEVWEAFTNDIGTAILVAEISDDFYLRENLPDGAARYYWLRSISYAATNNESTFTTSVNANARGIQYSDFQADVDPVGIVSSLPSPIGYTGPNVILNTSDNKLYRYTGSAFTAVVPATDITGQIVTAQIADAALTTAKFASGITPVEILGTLPVSGNYLGRTVMLTSDSKLYRYNGSAFVASVPTTDLTGQITTTQITDNAITTGKIAANAVTAGQIAANTITAGQIAADTITAGQIAAGAISASELAANSVIAGKIAADTITSNEIAANAITAAEIAAGAVTTAKLAANAVTANEIAANAIVAGKIAVAALAGNEISASAQLKVGTGENTTIISGIHPDLLQWAGSSTGSDAPFKLYKSGKLVTTDLEIRKSDGTLMFSGSTGFTDAAKLEIITNSSSAVTFVSSMSKPVAHSDSTSVIATGGIAAVSLGANSSMSVEVTWPIGLSSYGTNYAAYPSTVSIVLYERYRANSSAGWGSWNSIYTGVWTKTASTVVGDQYQVVTTSESFPSSSVPGDIDTVSYSFVNTASLYIQHTGNKDAGLYEYLVVAPNDPPFYSISSTVKFTDTDANPSIIVSSNSTEGSTPYANPKGLFKTLLIDRASVSTITATADFVVLSTPQGLVRTVASLNKTMTLSTVGADGRDYAASIAADTWHYLYVISTGSTDSVIASQSSTTPILPTGYSYYARIGAFRTDGSGNIKDYKQRGNVASYISTSAGFPDIKTGTTPSHGSFVYQSNSISGFVPPTASDISCLAHIEGGTLLLAPNSTNYGDPADSSGKFPYFSVSTGGPNENHRINIPLESTNIFIVSSQAANSVRCLGWVDNL